MADEIEFTCTYGGTCEQPAVIVVTREDATTGDAGPRVAYGCRSHHRDLARSMVDYVSGWGDVHIFVARLGDRHADALKPGQRTPYDPQHRRFWTLCTCQKKFYGSNPDEAEFFLVEHLEKHKGNDTE